MPVQNNQNRNPRIDGTRARFEWQGETAPLLIGDFNGWEHGQPEQFREEAPGQWSLTLEFPEDTYMEYAFWDGENRVADPLNPDTTPDGFGHRNHYFYMNAAAPTPFLNARMFPHGKVTRFDLPTQGILVGKTRPVWLYQPPVDEPCQLWVVWDGRDYLYRARLVNIVDAMIARKLIRPVALAMVQNGGTQRAIEYMCSDLSLAFLNEVVLPKAREQLKLIDPAEKPGAWGVMGASMGGLMALYAGLRMPEVFGQVLSQSGAFEFDGWKPVVQPLVAEGPRRPLRIWMDAGRFEWLLEPNRRMHALLRKRGYDVTIHEFSAGHNYPAWRNDLPRGLEHLLGPKE